MTETRTNPKTFEQVRPARLGLKLTPSATLTLTSPPWIKSVVERLDYLLRLPENWDQEGALAVSFEVAMSALSFLLERAFHDTPAPQLTPTAVGGLQLEWHVGGCDLEVVLSLNDPTMFFCVDSDGKETEGDALREEALVAQLIRKLPTRNDYNFFER